MRIRPPQAANAKINVTPMIDVVMCLIVFFLIVGQLASDRYEQIDLPASGVGFESDSSDPLVINIVRRDGEVRVVIEREEIDLATLESIARQHAGASAEGAIRVRAGRTLAYGDVRPVIDACRRAGVRSIALASEKTP